MSVAISTKKDYFGKWVASSAIPLEGKQVLKITTAKRELCRNGNSGDVVTIASVVEVDREQGYTVERFTMFEDFNKAVVYGNASRVTEKVVREQQAKALADLPFILENVKAFYAGKAVAA